MTIRTLLFGPVPGIAVPPELAASLVALGASHSPDVLRRFADPDSRVSRELDAVWDMLGFVAGEFYLRGVLRAIARNRPHPLTNRVVTTVFLFAYRVHARLHWDGNPPPTWRETEGYMRGFATSIGVPVAWSVRRSPLVREEDDGLSLRFGSLPIVLVGSVDPTSILGTPVHHEDGSVSFRPPVASQDRRC